MKGVVNMKTRIGMGHIIRALQLSGFGHDEIMTMRNAMLNNDFSGIEFCEDCYTEDWKEKPLLGLKRI
jgi:hypothetical protein